MRAWLGIALALSGALVGLGCDDETSSGGDHDPVVYRIPLDISFEDAAAAALPGDTLIFEFTPFPPISETVVFSQSQTPLVLKGNKDLPVIEAPTGFPAVRFNSPRAGTRVERLMFSGGNTTVNVSGSGAVVFQECKFVGGQIQLAASGTSLTVTTTECLFQEPSAFGIEVQSSTVLHADKVTIVKAGNSGIFVTGSARARVRNSIIYKAANFGIECTGQGELTSDSGCNDTFGNAFAVRDCTEPDTDYHADPQFCDEAHDVYTIMSTSPAAPANSGCGQVGAYLPACDPPPPPE